MNLITNAYQEKIILEFISYCIVIILIALLIFLIIRKTRKKPKEDKQNYPSNSGPTQYYPYEKKMLLSKAEYAFYNILKHKCDENNLLICPKVRMEDFINVTDKKNKLKFRGYIKSRHIDFMICDNKLHLLAGIELDDNSHKNADIIKTDEFKNNVFATIKLPLYRVKMSEGMYKDKIEHIINLIKPNTPAQEGQDQEGQAKENRQPDFTI